MTGRRGEWYSEWEGCGHKLQYVWGFFSSGNCKGTTVQPEHLSSPSPNLPKSLKMGGDTLPLVQMCPKKTSFIVIYLIVTF